MPLETSLPLSPFSRAAEQRYLSAPDKSAFDREREERGNTEKEGKEAGQERGKTGVGVDLRQDKEETERAGGVKMNAISEEKEEDVFFCVFSLPFRLFFFFFYLPNPILI